MAGIGRVRECRERAEAKSGSSQRVVCRRREAEDGKSEESRSARARIHEAQGSEGQKSLRKEDGQLT